MLPMTFIGVNARPDGQMVEESLFHVFRLCVRVHRFTSVGLIYYMYRGTGSSKRSQSEKLMMVKQRSTLKKIKISI